jgi:hypothetical protein
MNKYGNFIVLNSKKKKKKEKRGMGGHKKRDPLSCVGL